MNNEDQFETRLRRVPRRPVPPAWRNDILTAARRETLPHPSSRGAQASPLRTLGDLLSNALRPYPRAWAGLAATWLLILGLNWTAREPSVGPFAHHTAPPSPEMHDLLQQQARLLAELVGPIEKPRTSQPEPAIPQPRSQRREEFLNA